MKFEKCLENEVIYGHGVPYNPQAGG